jgi:hypothetical protein
VQGRGRRRRRLLLGTPLGDDLCLDLGQQVFGELAELGDTFAGAQVGFHALERRFLDEGARGARGPREKPRRHHGKAQADTDADRYAHRNAGSQSRHSPTLPSFHPSGD